MNKILLQQILEQEGFRKECYDLDGGHPPERYVLAQEGKSWSVYYSEHGLESGKSEFATEHEACQYLLAQLREDPFTK